MFRPKLRSENAHKHFILDKGFLVTGCHQNFTSIPVILTRTEICVNMM